MISIRGIQFTNDERREDRRRAFGQREYDGTIESGQFETDEISVTEFTAMAAVEALDQVALRTWVFAAGEVVDDDTHVDCIFRIDRVANKPE